MLFVGFASFQAAPMGPSGAKRSKVEASDKVEPSSFKPLRLAHAVVEVENIFCEGLRSFKVEQVE